MQPERLQFNSRGHRPRIEGKMISSTLKGSNWKSSNEFDLYRVGWNVWRDPVAMPPAIQSHAFGV
jgi:hypothetical protein